MSSRVIGAFLYPEMWWNGQVAVTALGVVLLLAVRCREDRWWLSTLGVVAGVWPVRVCGSRSEDLGGK